MNFEEFKIEVLKRAKKENACSGQYKRALEATSYDELAEVIKDNIGFNRYHSIVTSELAKKCDKPEFWNIGKENVGLFNSGDLNSGYRNSGYRNSGDLNSGYRNSGVFCNRKKEDTVPFFNKDSKMTWNEWYEHPAYYASQSLNITVWVSWINMTEEEKKEKPKAFVCEGYVKTFDYHTAWANLWKTLNDNEKSSFKTLPNFDSAIFEEITGIKF